MISSEVSLIILSLPCNVPLYLWKRMPSFVCVFHKTKSLFPMQCFTKVECKKRKCTKLHTDNSTTIWKTTNQKMYNPFRLHQNCFSSQPIPLLPLSQQHSIGLDAKLYFRRGGWQKLNYWTRWYWKQTIKGSRSTSKVWGYRGLTRPLAPSEVQLNPSV